jgi:hypothetical protein
MGERGVRRTGMHRMHREEVMQVTWKAAEVLEMACSSLWTLIYESNSRKERLLRESMLSCVRSSYLHHITVAKKECRVFVSLSASFFF